MLFILNQYLVRALRCLRVVRWPSLDLPLHVVMHRHIHLEETSLNKPFKQSITLIWKKGTATQTLVPKVPLEVQKNRQFFVNHVYYHVVTLGPNSNLEGDVNEYIKVTFHCDWEDGLTLITGDSMNEVKMAFFFRLHLHTIQSSKLRWESDWFFIVLFHISCRCNAYYCCAT